ncbi:hypothetical protein AGMMS49921_12420 [Endomicrobiia bacterium]|nr:hypothetical protein AGMMS49921_12420 [Endomicrobiia bacterium]
MNELEPLGKVLSPMSPFLIFHRLGIFVGLLLEGYGDKGVYGDESESAGDGTGVVVASGGVFSAGEGFSESDVDGSFFFFFGNERGISTDENFGIQ